MDFIDPNDAINTVPAGAWAIGVSGGIDSVALVELARGRADLHLHIAHLDHETRGGASAQDADFVAQLAAQWRLPSTMARLSEIVVPTQASSTAARFRAARFAFFKNVVEQHQLQGILLAHHADDQGETVLQRLLRGSGPAGLGGMSLKSTIGGLQVCRPLLGVRKESLRSLLLERGIPWREDVSNLTLTQQRNRVRQLLARAPELTPALIELAAASRSMMETLRGLSPRLAETFDVSHLSELPGPLAREAARRWLHERGASDVEVTPPAIDRLIEMAADAASPARQHFPGKLLVRRKSGRISAAPGASPPPPAPARG